MMVARDPVLVGVALREDDAAPLALGSALAALTSSSLAIVHAHPLEPMIALPPARWEEDVREKLHHRLEQLASPLRGQLDISVDVKSSPSAVRALHEAAEELGAAVLVAGASRRTGIGLVAPGGVGERLLHAAPCAVAIAPRGYADGRRGLRRIGVAFIDGPEGRDALAVATGLARQAGATVTTYSVVDPPRAEPPAEQAEHAAARLEAIIDRVRDSVPADVLDATEVLEGHAADELAKVSAGLDLLICGSRGYGPVRSTLVGGVSSRLAHSAACPLLVIPRAPVPGIATLTGRGSKAGA
jgi:nucleotide-binding universal stress UspA family protein